MLFADGALGLLLLGLWLFCLIDVITTSEADVRNLPKLVWLLIVVLLFDLGALAWLIAGRNWNRAPARPATGVASRYPEYDRPNRAAAQHPDDDEAFLAQLKARAEAQREQYRKRQQDDPDGPA